MRKDIVHRVVELALDGKLADDGDQELLKIGQMAQQIDTCLDRYLKKVMRVKDEEKKVEEQKEEKQQKSDKKE